MDSISINGLYLLCFTQLVYVNDGLWHRSRVEVAAGQVHITIDDTKQTTSFNTGFVSTSTEFYIGGTSKSHLFISTCSNYGLVSL